MSKRVIAGVSATAAVATGLVGGAMSGAPAEAAPRPYAKVCVVNPGGVPYTGPISLMTEGGLFNWGRQVFRHQRANGCTTFHGLKPRHQYWIVASLQIESCKKGSMSNGETFNYGSDRSLFASSRKRRAPKTGLVDYGRLTVEVQTKSCA